MRTVYHKFSTSEETCDFELKVNVLTDKGKELVVTFKNMFFFFKLIRTVQENAS